MSSDDKIPVRMIDPGPVTADQGRIHIQIRCQPAVRIIQHRHDFIQTIAEALLTVDFLLFAFWGDRLRKLIFTGLIQPVDDGRNQNIRPRVFCAAQTGKNIQHVFIIRITVDSPGKPRDGTAAGIRFPRSAFQTRDIGRGAVRKTGNIRIGTLQQEKKFSKSFRQHNLLSHGISIGTIFGNENYCANYKIVTISH